MTVSIAKQRRAMNGFVRGWPFGLALLLAAATSHGMSVSASVTAGADTQSTSQWIQLRAQTDAPDFHSSAGVSYLAVGIPAFDTLLSTTVSVAAGSRYGDEVLSGSARAQWSFQDSFVLTAPGVGAGTYGIMTAAIRLTPSSSTSGRIGGVALPTAASNWDSGVDWQASMEVRGHDGASVLGEVHRDFAGARTTGSDGESSYAYGGGVFEVTLPVRFGELVDIDISAWLNASTAVASEPLIRSKGLASAGLELSWAGILQLVTAGGTEVQTFSANSPSSGWNYGVAVVPEPNVGTLLLAGLSVLCGKRMIRLTRRRSAC